MFTRMEAVRKINLFVVENISRVLFSYSSASTKIF